MRSDSDATDGAPVTGHWQAEVERPVEREQTLLTASSHGGEWFLDIRQVSCANPRNACQCALVYISPFNTG
jgi:hypothetical protein